MDILHLNVATAMEDFKMVLKKDSPFYDNLAMTPSKKLNEVRNRALKLIKLEEDKKIRIRQTTPTIILARRMNLPPKIL